MIIAAGLVLLGIVLAAPPEPMIPTVAALPAIVSTALPPTALPAAQPTLPPTWTLTPTQEIPATQVPTPTPVFQPSPEPPTAGLDPSLLANTYWEGDGTASMWDYQFPDGSFGRFTVLPVNVWMGSFGNVRLTAGHEAALQNAIDQIGQVVPIQRVANRAFAHMTIWLMDDAEFERNADCDTVDYTIGCTEFSLTGAGILLNTVWLRITDENFDATLLHELTHGLGLAVHSPYADDLMYAIDVGQAARYSERDLNTLRALYQAPAFTGN
ncbi:MAG: hypothetical protein Kow0077_02280 [Anaerolineae bacterium]